MAVMIGVTPDTHDGSKLKTRVPPERIVYLWDSYLKALIDHGATPVVLPVTGDKKVIRSMLDRLDGFLLAGGNFDVPPSYYGEENKPWLGKLKPERSEFEKALLMGALDRNVPVLGICGGMQILNVAMGGTLYQDIARERPKAREHQQNKKKDSPSHQVVVPPGTRLYKIMTGGKKGDALKVMVNSTHHQAVKELAPGLVVCAEAADGIVEAVESPRHRFALGTQWHPELLYKKQKEQAAIFRAFVREAASR